MSKVRTLQCECSFGTRVEKFDTIQSALDDLVSHILSHLTSDISGATIIVNLVSMGMALFGLLAVLAASNMSDLNDDNFNYTEEELAAMEVYSGSVPMAVTYTLCRMALNALGIWGAYSYKVWPIGASLAAFAAEFLMSLIALNLPGAIYFGCFAYPHVYLIQEIRSGIMSKETYETEKQSCCCV